MGLAFMPKKERTQKQFDFTKEITKGMLGQLIDYNSAFKFRYSSFLVHFILH